jgi:ATP-dependent DNA helicase RecQ
MGVDKSNVRTVVHLSPPASTEAYLQESGRASRDGKGANAWLIWTAEDISDQSNESVTAAHARRDGMIRYASSTDRCRREVLLDALGIESQDCSGCDVCGGEPWTAAPEEKVILKVIRWNRGRFRKGQLARILIGRRTAEIRRAGLDTVRGFGALAGWELEDAEEAIGVLLQIGKVRFRPWIWTNSKLVPVNSGNMSWRRLYN